MPIVAEDLTADGATVNLLVGVSLPRRQVLERNKFPVPPRISVRAVLDTGSGVTAIDPNVLARLGIPPIDQIDVYTPSTGTTPHRCNRFHISLALPHEEIEMHFPGLLVIESVFLPNEGIQALIGRDLLDHCLLVYHGPQRNFSLAF